MSDKQRKVGDFVLPRMSGIVEQGEPAYQVEEITDEVNVASMELGDGGRILVRPSGTEPLVRVMVETFDPALASSVAEHLSNIVTRKDQRFR